MKYKSKCRICKKETPHIIFATNRLKGVKIKCEICESPHQTYTKIKLTEWVEEND